MKPRPFIRWAGSKRLLAETIVREIPQFAGRYIEPFLGSGAVFLRLRPSRAILGDCLEPLMNTWRQVMKDPAPLKRRVESWESNKDRYLQIRSTRFDSDLDRAAQFLYLNRTAYGGLWRLNANGVFNVPYSAPKTQNKLDLTNLKAVQDLLRGDVALHASDYRTLTAEGRKGDVVFLDPPYSKGREERPFHHYNEKLFDWNHQVELAHEAARLASLGAFVVVANSSHPEVQDLYADFQRIEVRRANALSAKAGPRGRVVEHLYISR